MPYNEILHEQQRNNHKGRSSGGVQVLQRKSGDVAQKKKEEFGSCPHPSSSFKVMMGDPNTRRWQEMKMLEPNGELKVIQIGSTTD